MAERCRFSSFLRLPSIAKRQTVRAMHGHGYRSLYPQGDGSHRRNTIEVSPRWFFGGIYGVQVRLANVDVRTDVWPSWLRWQRSPLARSNGGRGATGAGSRPPPGLEARSGGGGRSFLESVEPKRHVQLTSILGTRQMRGRDYSSAHDAMRKPTTDVAGGVYTEPDGGHFRSKQISLGTGRNRDRLAGRGGFSGLDRNVALWKRHAPTRSSVTRADHRCRSSPNRRGKPARVAATRRAGRSKQPGRRDYADQRALGRRSRTHAAGWLFVC